MYFFHKFVLDDISLDTIFQVFLPFAVFFLLSLFMVYLAKPVIKKVAKADGDKKGRRKGGYEERRSPAVENTQRSRPVYDGEEYLPQREYRTGPLPSMEEDRDMKVVPSSPYPEPVRKTPPAQRSAPVRDPYGVSQPRPQQRTAPNQAAARSAPAPRQQPAFRVEIPQEQMAPKPQRPAQPVKPAGSAKPSAHVVSPVEIPSTGDDFFAKYDDPAYIERRLRELGEKGDQEN